MSNTKINIPKKLTGVAVPLGALYTKDSPAIGEYPSLKKFASFCKEAGLGIIQLLPVNDSGTQSSPYSALSAFALHPIYLSLKDIDGFEAVYKNDAHFKKEYDKYIKNNPYKNRYDYKSILDAKNALLLQIFNSTEIGISGKPTDEMKAWVKKNPWVREYAVYKHFKWQFMQASWKEWPSEYKNYSTELIEQNWKDKGYLREHYYYVWIQMECEKQFSEAVDECHKLGILIKGDLPILMNEDSVASWAHPDIFNQSLRAGSPADGENPLGQNWGFPTYNWKNLKTKNYDWWKNRLKNAARFYDAYRLDHILGFFRIWAIPENDENALNGHTEPHVSISKDELYELGFDDDRIRWLSVPHVPTGAIEDITWNHEAAHKILKKFATKLDGEELWLMDKKSDIKDKKSPFGSRTISKADLNDICNDDVSGRAKDVLKKYWSDRTLIEISKGKYVPSWIYNKSTSWASLNENEKEKLIDLFAEKSKKENKLWEKSATEILTELTSCTKMIPCGEDLGVGFECVPRVMKSLGILGLRVVRWCRVWDKEGQPYVPFEDYEPLSVCTTSVHDSSTMRNWYESELVRNAPNSDKVSEIKFSEKFFTKPFSPKTALEVLKDCASAESAWFIPPLQDLLYLNQKYYLEKSDDERINIPGTVTDFNWTYRIPASVEDLILDKDLIGKIKEIR